MSELSFYDKEPRPWPNPLLTSASIVGHITDTTCRLWIRVFQPSKYWLVVSKEPFTVGDRHKAPKLSTRADPAQSRFRHRRRRSGLRRRQ